MSPWPPYPVKKCVVEKVIKTCTQFTGVHIFIVRIKWWGNIENLSVTNPTNLSFKNFSLYFLEDQPRIELLNRKYVAAKNASLKINGYAWKMSEGETRANPCVLLNYLFMYQI
jgi:hypothetical protein